MKIGELAKKAGCRVVTVRYYEKEGLLKQADRTSGNYRVYDEDDLERLKFIRHCRRHDMSLEETRRLLSYRDHPSADCLWIGDMIRTHIKSVDAQIRSLKELKKYLQELQKKCPPDGHDTCGIVESLDHAEICPCTHETKDADES